MLDSGCLAAPRNTVSAARGRSACSREQEGSSRPPRVPTADLHLTLMAKSPKGQDSGHTGGRGGYSPSLALRYSGFEEAYSGPSGPSGCLEEKEEDIPVRYSHGAPGHSRRGYKLPMPTANRITSNPVSPTQSGVSGVEAHQTTYAHQRGTINYNLCLSINT